jgi:predicted RNA binding protein YcfA (HicA-like mRNA interferase family)
MVAITAEVLVRYLERAGFVVMRRPPRKSPR